MDLELERFKIEIDLCAFAEGFGYTRDPKKSWAGSCVMRHGNGDKIIITRDAADGHHMYCSVRNASDKGSIVDFTQRRLNCSLGAARKEMRAFLGRTATSPTAPYPPLAAVGKDRTRVERSFGRMRISTRHAYLENERCIPRQVLESRRFAGRIRTDERHGNAVFPHFDATGLCGFEIKNRGFTGFSTGGSKGLWTSHTEDGDNRLAVFESAIDALSFAALFPEPHTRYASMGGRPTPKQRELLRAAAAVMPASSTVVAAMDADRAGRELVEIVREAVKLTGRGDLSFEPCLPTGFKDFNDQLRSERPRDWDERSKRGHALKDRITNANGL